VRYAGSVWFRCSCISSTRANPASRLHDLSTAGKFRSRRELERARYLREGCLLCFAHRHATDPEESALLGCLGNVLADLTQPAFEGGSIARRLRINHGPSFAQRLDALRFDLGRFAATTTMTLAKLIIELAKAGERERERLSESPLKRLSE